MGLSLNNIYQRPYVQPDKRGGIKRREDEKTSSATQEAQKEQQSNQNNRSKGLQNLEQKQPTYTPAYEQKFSLPAQNAYSNVNINYTNNTPTQTSTNVENQTAQAINPKVANQINIAQILKDFKNTALAIGTPDDLNDIVDGYIAVIEKQVKNGKANKTLIKNTLNSAASILDNYISETLNKDSKVVENWVDALFLQNIDLEYNEEDINERFLVKFPDGSTSQTKKQEELQNATAAQDLPQQVNGENSNVIPISVAGTNSKSVPVDKELKSLFIKAKKYTYTDKPEEAIKVFEQALNRALELDDTETSGKIYYEVGKIYDEHDYVAQALKSYNQSLKLTTDENVKTKAHYAMAKIYDDVNQITPAMDHYFSTVSHAGEAENFSAQTASLTKIGNIYTDMYEKEAFNYYDIAYDIANETDDDNLKGFVATNTGRAYQKFDEPEKALKAYSNAVKNYTDAETPLKTAQNYVAAADLMVEFNNLKKATNLLQKAQKYATQTEDTNLMNEINTKISQLQYLV